MKLLLVKFKLTGSLSSQKGFSYYQPFINETQNTIDNKVASKLNGLDTTLLHNGKLRRTMKQKNI